MASSWIYFLSHYSFLHLLLHRVKDFLFSLKIPLKKKKKKDILLSLQEFLYLPLRSICLNPTFSETIRCKCLSQKIANASFPFAGLSSLPPSLPFLFKNLLFFPSFTEISLTYIVAVQLPSRVQLLGTPLTAAHI